MEMTDFKSGEKRIHRGKNRRPDISTMVFGKLPPQAKELEEAVLGAIMVQAGALDIISEWLYPEAFYVDAHQRIFKAMSSLQKKNLPIDCLTVTEELKIAGELEMVGGPYYITRLTNSVVSSANIETHAKIVFEKFALREMIRIGGEMVSEAYEDSTDVFQLLDQVEIDIFNTTNFVHKKNYVPIDNLLVKGVQELEHKRTQPDHLSGVPSGFPAVDKVTHGWQPTDLIILAARPGVGKTAFALNLARNAALDQFKPTPVAFFSLEMSSGQLINRIISCESEIWLEKIQRGRIDEAEGRQVYSSIQKLSKAKIFIDDTPGLNIYELRAKCRRLKTAENVGLIIIDYLQLMSGVSNNRQQNREQDISEISRNLKKLAKELNLPVIALSQLSRETEKRSNKVPQLSDLRESGAIEQDADSVMFMYRPGYYDIHSNDMGESNRGETQIRFAKYRHGSLDTIKLHANLGIQKFTEGQPLHVPKTSEVDGNKISGPIVEPDPTDDLPF